MSARDFLTALYLDWFNNWLSVEAFAQHHGLEYADAKLLIQLARDVTNTKHPEA